MRYGCAPIRHDHAHISINALRLQLENAIEQLSKVKELNLLELSSWLRNKIGDEDSSAPSEALDWPSCLLNRLAKNKSVAAELDALKSVLNREALELPELPKPKKSKRPSAKDVDVEDSSGGDGTEDPTEALSESGATAKRHKKQEAEVQHDASTTKDCERASHQAALDQPGDGAPKNLRRQGECAPVVGGLHASWVAKQKLKEAQSAGFTGRKVRLDDDDDDARPEQPMFKAKSPKKRKLALLSDSWPRDPKPTKPDDPAKPDKFDNKISHSPAKPNLHPSWVQHQQAKQAKARLLATTTAQKIVFDDD